MAVVVLVVVIIIIVAVVVVKRINPSVCMSVRPYASTFYAVLNKKAR